MTFAMGKWFFETADAKEAIKWHTAKAWIGKSFRILGRFVGTSMTGILNIFKNSFSCNDIYHHHELIKAQIVIVKLECNVRTI